MKFQKTKKTGLAILKDSVRKTPQSLWSAGKKAGRHLNALNPGEDLREEEKRKKRSGKSQEISVTQFMSYSERKKWDKLSDRKKEQILRKERSKEDSAYQNERTIAGSGKNKRKDSYAQTSYRETSFAGEKHLGTIQKNGSGIRRINIDRAESVSSNRQEVIPGKTKKKGTENSSATAPKLAVSSSEKKTATAGKTAAASGKAAASAAATGGISIAAELGKETAKKAAKKFREKLEIENLQKKEALRITEQEQKKREEQQKENQSAMAASSGTDSNGLSNKIQKAVHTVIAVTTALMGGLMSVLSSIFAAFIIAMIIVVVLVSFYSKTGGSGRQRMVEAALAEYEESDKNVGGVKYKDWYGLDDNWCGMFVAYCGDKCGFVKEGIIVKSASVSESKSWYEARGEFHTKESGYIPLPGDIIYFTNNASHMGIVIEYDEKTDHVITIEGNSGSSATEPYHKGSHVKKGSYVRTAFSISGYASPAYPDMVDELNGATNAEKIFNALVSQGYSEQAAAAVVGNLYREAGVDASGDIKLHSVNPSGSSVGIVQWTGGRKEAFLKYAEDAGEPWPDTGLGVQINYLLLELSSNQWLWTANGSEYGSDCNISLAEFKQLTDVEYATRVYCAMFERCHIKDAALPYRIEKAKAAYASFGGK